MKRERGECGRLNEHEVSKEKGPDTAKNNSLLNCQAFAEVSRL